MQSNTIVIKMQVYRHDCFIIELELWRKKGRPRTWLVLIVKRSYNIERGGRKVKKDGRLRNEGMRRNLLSK